MRAGNSAGLSSPTAAVPLTISACSSPPGPPGAIRVIATGLLTSLVWDPPASGADRYVIEGEGPLSQGAGDHFSFATPSPANSFEAAVPYGSYRVHVRGRNACGVGPPSPDVVVLVPYVYVGPF